MTDEQFELSEELRCVKKVKNKIKALECELEQIQNFTVKCTVNYDNDGSKSGTHRNSTEDSVIEYLTKSDNLCKEISIKKRKAVEKIEKVKIIINTIDDEDLYSVLSLMYISCLSIETIAEKLDCGITTVKRKRNAALNIIIESGLEWSS